MCVVIPNCKNWYFLHPFPFVRDQGQMSVILKSVDLNNIYLRRLSRSLRLFKGLSRDHLSFQNWKTVPGVEKDIHHHICSIKQLFEYFTSSVLSYFFYHGMTFSSPLSICWDPRFNECYTQKCYPYYICRQELLFQSFTPICSLSLSILCSPRYSVKQPHSCMH